MLVTETMEVLKGKIMKWKESVEVKVNVSKTKVMECGRNRGVVERMGKWPCGVCGKGVARNSIQCKECELWDTRSAPRKKHLYLR